MKKQQSHHLGIAQKQKPFQAATRTLQRKLLAPGEKKWDSLSGFERMTEMLKWKLKQNP